MWKEFCVFLLDCFFPSYCCVCKKNGQYLCHQCYANIPFLNSSLQIKITPLYIDEAWAVSSHHSPITSLLYQLKYRSIKGIGEYCGDLICYCLSLPKVHAVVTVPLHPKKLKHRGFNQAQVIGQRLAQNLGIPWYDLLSRKRDSRSQASGMNKSNRITNTENLYTINIGVLKKLQAKNELPLEVLLVDDVITTGSTTNACAKVLKKFGVKRVIAVAVTYRA